MPLHCSLHLPCSSGSLLPLQHVVLYTALLEEEPDPGHEERGSKATIRKECVAEEALKLQEVCVKNPGKARAGKAKKTDATSGAAAQKGLACPLVSG